MSLEKLLDYSDSQMVLVQSRYGFGWVAGVELEDFPVIITVNDNNGEHEVDYYGQFLTPEAWFPYATGNTPLEAVAALDEKLKAWGDSDLRNVWNGLGIIRALNQLPRYGVKAKPITLKDLDDWLKEWNSKSDVTNADILIVK